MVGHFYSFSPFYIVKTVNLSLFLGHLGLKKEHENRLSFLNMTPKCTQKSRWFLPVVSQIGIRNK